MCAITNKLLFCFENPLFFGHLAVWRNPKLAVGNHSARANVKRPGNLFYTFLAPIRFLMHKISAIIEELKSALDVGVFIKS